MFSEGASEQGGGQVGLKFKVLSSIWSALVNSAYVTTLTHRVHCVCTRLSIESDAGDVLASPEKYQREEHARNARRPRRVNGARMRRIIVKKLRLHTEVGLLVANPEICVNFPRERTGGTDARPLGVCYRISRRSRWAHQPSMEHLRREIHTPMLGRQCRLSYERSELEKPLFQRSYVHACAARGRR